MCANELAVSSESSENVGIAAMDMVMGVRTCYTVVSDFMIWFVFVLGLFVHNYIAELYKSY